MSAVTLDDAGQSAGPPDLPAPLLEVTDLTVDFSSDDGAVHAVRGVSYRVRPG